MKKISVTNTSNMPIYIGSHMVAAGDTREFDEDIVPEQFKPAPVAEVVVEAAPDALAALEGLMGPDLVAAMPGLTIEQLELLGDREQAKGEAASKTILTAVAEEILKRGAGEAGRAEVKPELSAEEKEQRTSEVVANAAAAIVAGEVTLEDAVKQVVGSAPFEVQGDDITARITAKVAALKAEAKAAAKAAAKK